MVVQIVLLDGIRWNIMVLEICYVKIFEVVVQVDHSVHLLTFLPLQHRFSWVKGPLLLPTTTLMVLSLSCRGEIEFAMLTLIRGEAGITHVHFCDSLRWVFGSKSANKFSSVFRVEGHSVLSTGRRKMLKFMHSKLWSCWEGLKAFKTSIRGFFIPLSGLWFASSLIFLDWVRCGAEKINEKWYTLGRQQVHFQEKQESHSWKSWYDAQQIVSYPYGA